MKQREGHCSNTKDTVKGQLTWLPVSDGCEWISCLLFFYICCFQLIFYHCNNLKHQFTVVSCLVTLKAYHSPRIYAFKLMNHEPCDHMTISLSFCYMFAYMFAYAKHRVSPQGNKPIRVQFVQHFPHWKMPNIRIFFPISLQKDVQG